jgi:hypothetical protein
MRRHAFLLLALAAFAVPAAAVAATGATGDGTLVVLNGTAPYTPGDLSSSVPVVRLIITGSVIGQLKGQGMIIIDGGAKSPAPEVVGAGAAHAVAKSDTAQQWFGDVDGFKFRAVGGTYTVVIYGAHISLVAVGTGSVVLTGTPNTPIGDGRYSLNGDTDFKSLPGTPTNKLSIDSNG